jgi:DNA-binding protein YbaB
MTAPPPGAPPRASSNAVPGVPRPAAGQLLHAEDLVKGMKQAMEQAQQQVLATQAAMASNEATVSSSDNAITVTVNPTGAVTSVRFGAKVEAMKAAQLSTAFMATYRKAAQQVMQRSLDILESNGAANTSSTAQVRRNLEAMFDDDEDES